MPLPRLAGLLAAMWLAAACSVHAAESAADERLLLVELLLPQAVRIAADTQRLVSAKELRDELEPIKARLVSALGLQVIQWYDHLPLLAVLDSGDLRRRELEAAPGVMRVFAPPRATLQITATNSANQMQAGLAQAAGFSGIGATVLVTDSGIGPTPPVSIHPDFGPCTGIGVPAACQLRSWQVLDPKGSEGHGTNVAATVARTARGSGIHFADVGGVGTSISPVLAFSALDWAVANQAAENIVAHNMSWGSTPTKGSPCSIASSVFATAKSAGIVQVAAAGNDSSASEARIIRWPACNPHVVSVGAINSTTGGAAAWTVAGFSNAESVLSFLAPGVQIQAGGFTLSGTSMASPHVTGAYAILRASNAWQAMPIDELTSHLRATGQLVMDQRLGIAFPVPMIYQARPIRLNVANRFAVAYEAFPPPVQACGPDCGHYRVNTTVTVSVPPGYVTEPCGPSAPSACDVALSGNRSIVVHPDWVTPTVMAITSPTDTSDIVFANGFEGS